MVDFIVVCNFWVMVGHTLVKRILVLTFVLFGLGLLMIGSASFVDGAKNFGDKWHYLKLQSTWGVLGLFSMLVFSKIDFRILHKNATILAGISLFFLLLVLIPGIGIKVLGARRWLGLGPIGFQPAEMAKLFLAIFWSALIKKDIQKYSTMFGSLIIAVGLIMLEPDLGSALILVFISLSLFWATGGKILKMIFISVTGILIVGLLILLSPYRMSRLKTFFDVSHDPLGASYQVRQAVIGFGSGGIFGTGLGQSRQKYVYLPEATTDSIFSVLGEEFGFVGAVTALLLFLALVWHALKVAERSNDDFKKNLAICIACWIGGQFLLNIAAITALVPLTGIPLPFISYGGSSLFVLLSAIGILINIAKDS